MSLIVVLCFYAKSIWADNSVPFARDDSFELQRAKNFGQTTGIAQNSEGDLFLFHRGEFNWGAGNTANSTKIKDDCIVKLDANGNILQEFGADTFLIPHGLYIDGNDNIWVTDVGRHQVMKYDQTGKKVLELGTENTPGVDGSHFNKPTDVVVDKDGYIYISDGYGNSRVAIYNKEMTFVKSFGNSGNADGEFDIPHSITCDDDGNIYVGDRQNRRVQKISGILTEKPTVTIVYTSTRAKADDWHNHLSAVHYDSKTKRLYLIDGPDSRFIDAKGQLSPPIATDDTQWPHDLIVTHDKKNSTELYVVLLQATEDKEKVAKYSEKVASYSENGQKLTFDDMWLKDY